MRSHIVGLTLGLLFGTVSGLWAADSAETTRKGIAVLRSDAGTFDKARACQQLGECGTAEAVPALAALLGDEKLGAYARAGLEGIGGASATAALRAVLEQVRGTSRLGVIDSLGVLRDGQAVSVLRRLAEEPASEVARAALRALGRIATPDAIQTLREALAVGRADAPAACLLAAERQRELGASATAIALYDAVARAQAPFSARVGALRGAILARKAEGTPLLLASLRAADPAGRQAALSAIREAPSEVLADGLHALLPEAPSDLRVPLILALLDCHNPRTGAALRAQLETDPPEVRRAALEVLGRIGGPEDVAAMLKVARGNPSESGLALAALGRLEGTAVDGRILEALGAARESEWRIKLIRLLGAREAVGALPELLRQAADADPAVSVAAFRAAGPLAGRDQLSTLITLIQGCRDASAREAAEGALVTLCAKLEPAVQGEAPLTELRRASKASDKLSWVRVLVALGHADALPTLQAMLAEADHSLAEAVIDELGRWPGPAPIDSLLALAERDTAETLRPRAVTAAIRLAAAAAEDRQRPEETLVGWFARAARHVQSAEQKRLLVSGLGRLRSVGGLRLLLPYVEDPAVVEEAALAAVAVSQQLSGPQDKLRAKSVLERIVKANRSQSAVARAKELVSRIPGESQPLE